MNLFKDVVFLSDKEIIEGQGIVDCHSKQYTVKLKGVTYIIVEATSNGYYCIELKEV